MRHTAAGTMVRIRQRYMLCKLVHKSGSKFCVFGHTQNEVEEAVRRTIDRMYGVYGAALCRDVTVKYFHASSGKHPRVLYYGKGEILKSF